MRVLLINPPLNTSLPAAGVYPMGLAYIAAVLRQNHCDVDILDIRLNDYDRSFVSNWFLRNRGRYDLYGIGGMVTAYSWIQWLSREIRKASPSSMIVAGGSICTAGELLLQKSEVDIVCIGDGEKTAQSIVDALHRREDLASIPNALVKRNGSILHTRREEPMALDAVPRPAWELLDMEKYTATSYLVPVTARSITMITGRGCPYNCSFCYRNFGRRLRHRSVDNVIQEMREVVDRYGIGHIDFLDEIFNADRDYVNDLCRRIIEERFRLTWRCTGRANLVDRELLQLMYEAGCRWIGYGIESGSQKMLDDMGKRQRVEDVERSIRLARDAGMIVTGTFILGLPGETEHTIQETEQFFVRNRIFNVPFFPVPYPGTRLFDDCREKNLLSFDESFVDSLEKDATELIVNLTEMPDARLLQRREELDRTYSYLIPSMRLQGGLYTVNVDARVDDAIEKDLDVIVDRLKSHRTIKSIVLGGGFGRGEGSVLVDENGVRPVNDYDIFVVVSDEDSTDYRPIGAELARELNVRWVDIIPVKSSSIATLPPSQFHYDLKYGSRHLWGEYMLDRIPTYPDGRVDGESINTLLLNRLICALEAYSEEFERRTLTPQEAFFLINQTGKVVSACIECLLMKDGRYHPSYRTRRERFERIFSSEFSLIQLNETATQFKLRPSPSLVTHPVAYWEKAIREYVRLLASFFVADAGPSVMALIKAVLNKRTSANPIERAELLLLLCRVCPEAERPPLLAAVRSELEHITGNPVWKSDWEKLRTETVELWRRASHGKSERKRQGKEVVLMILIDGLRHDYINPQDAPFLHSLGEKNIEGRVRETFAFELRPAFFAGLHPDECDVANMYCYSPASSPFAELDLSSGQRDVIDRQLRDFASRKGYTLVKHVGSSAEIPIRLLKYFDFSEKYNTSDPSSIPGRKTIFDLLRERNKRFLWIGYPDGPGTTRDVKDLLMSRLTEEVDFIYLHFSELDWVGHEFGPHTERQRAVLSEIDNAVREVFGRLNRTFSGVRFIVFGDHGQVAIEKQIDLQSRLDRSGLILEKDFLYFLDSTQARFWFFNDRAREVITEILRGIPEGKILSRGDMKSLHFDFGHNRFGDLIFVVQEGVGLFPNFFQSANPCKGLHGFLPEVESNWAALIVGGCGIRLRVERVVEMVDLFPTLLQFLGLGRSPHPTAGISLLERHRLEIQCTRHRASLVMPTYNRLEILKRSLRAIEDQKLSRGEYELIVIDDGSTDGTLEYLEQYGKQTPLHLTVMTQDHAGPAAARNKGIQAASGEIVIFVGDDMIPSENFISTHLSFHDENPQLAAACLGFIDWSKDIEINPLMEHVTSMEGGQQFNYGTLDGPMPDGICGDAFWFFWSSNLSVKRAFLLNHGLFNEEIFKHAMWEDIELGYRLQKAGLKLYYRKACTVYHEHQLSLKSFAERQRKVGWYAHDAEQLGIPVETFKKGENQIYSAGILDALVSSLSSIPKGRFSRSATARMFNYCLEYAARLGYRERMYAPDTDADVVASLLFNALEENGSDRTGCEDARSFNVSSHAETVSTAARPHVSETATGERERQAAEAHEGIIKLLVAAGKRAEAVFALERLGDSFPDYAPAYNDLGVLYGESGDLPRALSSYEKAVSLDPGNPVFRKNLGDFFYVIMKRREDAVLQYEKALQINPQDAETLIILGNLRVESCDFRKAKESYLRILEIDPSNDLAAKMFDALDERGPELQKGDAESLFREARVHARRGLTDRAIGALEKLLAVCPDHALAHNDLGHLNHGKGYAAKALDHYEKAVALDPYNITALKNLADFYFVESEKIEDALSLYNRVLLEQPRDVEALKAIGKICIRLERLEDACTFFQTVMTIDPADIDTLVSYGHVLAAIGRFEVAETLYRRVAVLDPSNADARMGIEYISTAQGLSRNKIPEGPPISAASAATGTQEVSETQEVGIDWTEAFDYRKLTREELEEYSNIEVTEDLREGGIHAQKAWGYWFRYLSERVWKTSLSKEIVSFCNEVDHPRILSLGCGYGGLELKIAESLTKAHEITAVDINEGILAKARKEARVHDLNIRFLQLDLNFLEIQENAFDVIFAHASLHHLLNLEHVFHQIHKGLKDRGRLVVQDIIGKTQVLFWKDNVEYAKDVVRSMPARYTSGISNQHGIIPAYTEPSVQKGMEGIRQEEIPSLLGKYFFPIKMFEYGSFMRMICTHPELGPRFDPDRKEDRKYLERLFRLDLRQIEKKILRPTEMLAIYEKRVGLDTRRIDADGRVHLGNYLLQHGECDRAVRHFKSALLLDPENHAAQRSLAAATDASGPSERSAEAVSAITPDDRMVVIAASKCNDADRNETAEAFEKIRVQLATKGALSTVFFALCDFLERYPDYAAAHNDLGALYHERGDKEKALFHYQRAQELEPENIAYLKTLADFHYVETLQIDEAVSLYQKSIALHSRNVETYLILGNIDVERNKFDTALAYFIEALKIDPTNEHASQMVGALKAKIQHQIVSERDSHNSIHRNKLQWSTYAWPEGGDEWSASWGGTEALWHKTILPRIGALLPAEHILEIAPGYGRCTQYLATQCRNMTLVDLTEKCIESCKQRFRDLPNIRYVVNDGKSLEAVDNESVDFVFSWDSLVHVEKDVMEAYLHQLASKLKTGGMGFLHHSNIGAFRDAATCGLTVENRHWRGESMSAELFRAYCRAAGLRCLSQEILAWGGEVLNDCFSVITKGSSQPDQPPRVVENPHFMQEASGRGSPPDFYRALGIRKGSFAAAAPEESYRKARGFIEESKFTEAARALGDYLLARPGDALAHNDLGCLYYRLGERDKALEHYEKAVELEPGNATYMKNLADVYHVEQGRTDDALRLYHRILADDPGDVETLLALGHICIAVARLDDARTFFERALASDPHNETARTILARLRSRPDRVPAEDVCVGKTSVSIIIPAGDDPKILSRCIGTVLQNTVGADYEIVMTSGIAPACGEESFVPAEGKSIRLTALPVNGNPVASLNAAARKATGRYLVCMDSRIVLTRGWLDPLLKTAVSNSMAGAVSPRVGMTPDTLVEAGFTVLTGDTAKGNGEGERIDTPRYNFACETPSGSRYLTLMPRAAWEQCGGFDEELTDFGMALMDLSLSIRAAGKSLIYQPLSAVGLMESPCGDEPGRNTPPKDPGWVHRMRPSLLEQAGAGEAGRGRKSVLVLGVYLADRLNTAEDIASILSASNTCRVTQRWVALGDAPPAAALKAVTARTIRERTPKFRIVNDLLAGEDLSRYDYVLLTDDDIVMPEGFLDAFIGLQEKLGFAVAQPARTSNSYIDHPIVEQANGLLARETRFVEIGPVVSFHRSAYDLVFPFDLTSPMGWGYENVWSFRLVNRGLKMGIIDVTPVDHSIRKPVANYDWSTADRQRADFLDRNEHLPLETCFTTLQAIRLEGDSK